MLIKQTSEEKYLCTLVLREPTIQSLAEKELSAAIMDLSRSDVKQRIRGNILCSIDSTPKSILSRYRTYIVEWIDDDVGTRQLDYEGLVKK